jgi:hypothetical protein
VHLPVSGSGDSRHICVRLRSVWQVCGKPAMLKDGADLGHRGRLPTGITADKPNNVTKPAGGLAVQVDDEPRKMLRFDIS